jgi:hypothetical protein
VQVNHSELLASPRPSQESQLNECGDVGARRGGGRKNDPQTWFANLDASTAAAFCANHSQKNLTAIAAFAGPAAGAAGRSQEKFVIRILLRRSAPGLVLDNGPRGGPGGSGAALRHLRTPPLQSGIRRSALPLPLPLPPKPQTPNPRPESQMSRRCPSPRCQVRRPVFNVFLGPEIRPKT